MANENETVADIVAEMRERAEAMQTHGTTHGVKLAVREFANRIEAAWKQEREELDKRISDLEAYAKLWTGRADELRLKCDEFYAKAKPVGNAAAMREALVKCREIALQWQADEAAGVAGTTDKPSARSAAEAVIDMEFEINAALAAPARNCDLYATATEALKAQDVAFNEDNFKNGECRLGCPGCDDGLIDCKILWLFAPAAERKGDGDGR